MIDLAFIHSSFQAICNRSRQLLPHSGILHHIHSSCTHLVVVSLCLLHIYLGCKSVYIDVCCLLCRSVCCLISHCVFCLLCHCVCLSIQAGRCQRRTTPRIKMSSPAERGPTSPPANWPTWKRSSLRTSTPTSRPEKR